MTFVESQTGALVPTGSLKFIMIHHHHDRATLHAALVGCIAAELLFIRKQQKFSSFRFFTSLELVIRFRSSLFLPPTIYSKHGFLGTFRSMPTILAYRLFNRFYAILIAIEVCRILDFEFTLKNYDGLLTIFSGYRTAYGSRKQKRKYNFKNSIKSASIR